MLRAVGQVNAPAVRNRLCLQDDLLSIYLESQCSHSKSAISPAARPLPECLGCHPVIAPARDAPALRARQRFGSESEPYLTGDVCGRFPVAEMRLEEAGKGLSRPKRR